MDILVSVIVPVYNVSHYINRCIASIVQQTYMDIEIILVDDGSPDESSMICDEWAQNDSRIIVVHQKNGGPSAARNKGILLSHGEYIAFVDSDDSIHPDYVKLLLGACINGQCQIAQCEYICCKTGIPNVLDSYTEEQYCILSHTELFLSRKDLSSPWVYLYKRELITREFEPFPIGRLHEDEAFTYKRLYWANNIAVLPCVLYYYNVSSVGIMRNVKHIQSTDFLEFLEDRITFFSDKGSELYDMALLHYCKSMILFYGRCKCDRYNENNLNEILDKTKNKWKILKHSKQLSIKERMIIAIFVHFPALFGKAYRMVRS